MKKGIIAIIICLFIFTACQPKPAVQTPVIGTAGPDVFQLSSPAFANGNKIPVQYTCDSGDIGKSPEINWRKVPAGTNSLAIIVEDPDTPFGTFVHWVIYNISPGNTGLPEGLPLDGHVPGMGTQGINGFNTTGYGGPCPPFGMSHRYIFNMYALDLDLSTPDGLDASQLKGKMNGHILAQAALMGIYK